MRALRAGLAGYGGERLDRLLAAGIVVELELEIWLAHGISGSHRLLTAVAAVFVAAPVAARRRRPAAALIFSAAAATIQALLGGALNATDGLAVMLALVLLAYSLGARLDAPRGLFALLLGGGVFSGFVLLSASSPSGGIGTELFFLALIFATPWFLGRVAQERSRRAAAFHRLEVQAGTEHGEREREAIAQERVRIGRELQDIIAHSVSAMVIQAGGAQRMLRSDPERARESILTVERTGREALGDLRRLLGMLRKDDDPRALAPQPGLGQLATLLRATREAGVACQLRTDGEQIELMPGVDLVAYRILEAVLGCAAHHRAGRAVVAVRYRLARLELEVHGDRSIPNLAEELAGMSERVRLYDGTLEALPAEGDGFALRARLPLGVAAPA